MKTLVLLAVALAIAAPLAQSERSAPFALAVLRRDGIAAPFATFDGRGWKASWPQSVFTQELPISLADVPRRWWGLDPPPQKFTLWREAARAGEVTVGAPTIARPMCDPRLVLRSDFTPTGPLPPPIERPYPKEGLLVSGEVAVTPITPVEKGSAEWNAMVLRLAKDFNEAEDDAVSVFTGWRHPVRADRRKLVPIIIEALYRAPADTEGWTAYFVEAVRQYPPGPQDKDGCGPLTFANGWILLGPKNKEGFRINAVVTYCDRHRINYMLPFGLIKAGGRNYWVFQFSGFDTEMYEVVRPTPKGIEAQVAYRVGTCPE